MSASTPLRPLVDSLEQTAALDAPGEAIGKAVRNALSPGAVKDALSGTWLGHAVHPPLTDVVIGSFLGASMLDVLAPGSHDAARRLIGVGIAAAVPTALTGANDWADTEVADTAVRRVGLVHAAANVTALGPYPAAAHPPPARVAPLALSAPPLPARRNGARGRGTALALAGAAVLTLSGYLGGHMS